MTVAGLEKSRGMMMRKEKERKESVRETAEIGWKEEEVQKKFETAIALSHSLEVLTSHGMDQFLRVAKEMSEQETAEGDGEWKESVCRAREAKAAAKAVSHPKVTVMRKLLQRLFGLSISLFPSSFPFPNRIESEHRDFLSSIPFLFSGGEQTRKERTRGR